MEAPFCRAQGSGSDAHVPAGGCGAGPIAPRASVPLPAQWDQGPSSSGGYKHLCYRQIREKWFLLGRTEEVEVLPILNVFLGIPPKETMTNSYRCTVEPVFRNHGYF